MFKQNKTKKQTLRKDYSHLRSKESRWKRIKKVFPKIAFHQFKRIFIGIPFLLVLLVLTIFFFLPLIKNSSVFKVNDLNVKGNNEIKVEDLNVVLNEYKGKSMFDVKEATVERRLKSQFNFIKNVHVRKILPGKLEIEVEEKYPQTALLTKEGIFLVDEDLNLISKVGELTADLKDYEKKLINNEGDINAVYVQERYANIQEDNKVEWSKLSNERKSSILNEITSEAKNKFNSYVNTAGEVISNSKFKNIPLIVDVLSNEEDRLQNDGKRFNFTLEVRNELDQKELRILRYVWINEYKLSVELDQNREILLTDKRDIDEQIRDLSAIMWNNQLLEGRIFDLRTSNYSIRNR